MPTQTKAKVKLSELPRLKEEKDQVSQENRKLKGEAQEFRAQIADIAGLLQQMTQPARTAGAAKLERVQLGHFSCFEQGEHEAVVKCGMS